MTLAAGAATPAAFAQASSDAFAWVNQGSRDPSTWTKVESPAPAMTGIWRRAQGEGNLYDPTRSVTDQIEVAPYNEEYKAIYADIIQREADGRPVYDPTGACIPTGMPRMMQATYGMEILQTPGQVTLIAEYFSEVRRIYTDGRSHPAPDDLEPAFVGHSIGRWVGEELVVDTIGIKPGTLLDSSLAPRSERPDQRVTERWRMTGPDSLQIEITLHDPGSLTQPWTVVKNFRRVPADDYMREYVCTENNRDPRLVGLVPIGEEDGVVVPGVE